MSHDRKDGTRTQQWDSERSGHRRGGGHRNEAPWLPLEQQEFYREQHRREGGREDCGHASGRARHQESLPFRGGEMKRLGEEGAERAAGHDDRTFGAERAPRTDGDRRGERLQQRHLGAHPTAPDQDCFHCLGDAVSPDFLGAVPGHEPNDQAACHRDENCGQAELVVRRRDQLRAEPVIVRQIGDERR